MIGILVSFIGLNEVLNEVLKELARKHPLWFSFTNTDGGRSDVIYLIPFTIMSLD